MTTNRFQCSRITRGIPYLGSVQPMVQLYSLRYTPTFLYRALISQRVPVSDINESSTAKGIDGSEQITYSINRGRSNGVGQYPTMNRALVAFLTFRLEVVGGKQDHDQEAEEEDGASANLGFQRCPIVIKVVAGQRMAEEGLEGEVEM